jgi:hypothetical protein
MRTLLAPRTVGTVVVACLALAVAPAAVAASPDLINQIQQQVNAAGGTLPTTPPAQQSFVNGLVSSGVLPASEASAAQEALNAIAAVAPNTPASTVAELFQSGLTPTQITDLLNIPQTTATLGAYDTFLQGFSIPGDATPTGNQLRPLSDALRNLAAAPGVPAGAATLLTQLANQIDAVGAGDLPSSLLDQLRGTLAAVGALTSQGLGALNHLLGTLIPVSRQSTPSITTPTATTPQQTVVVPQIQPFNLTVKVAKIKLARDRKSAAVTLRSSVPAPSLPVGFATVLGRKSAAKPVLLNLATGKNVTKKVKLTRAATKTLKKKGGTLKVVPAFALPGLSSVPGVTLAETAKSLKVRKPRAHRRRR